MLGDHFFPDCGNVILCILGNPLVQPSNETSVGYSWNAEWNAVNLASGGWMAPVNLIRVLNSNPILEGACYPNKKRKLDAITSLGQSRTLVGWKIQLEKFYCPRKGSWNTYKFCRLSSEHENNFGKKETIRKKKDLQKVKKFRRFVDLGLNLNEIRWGFQKASYPRIIISLAIFANCLIIFVPLCSKTFQKDSTQRGILNCTWEGSPFHKEKYQFSFSL